MNVLEKWQRLIPFIKTELVAEEFERMAKRIIIENLPKAEIIWVDFVNKQKLKYD